LSGSFLYSTKARISKPGFKKAKLATLSQGLQLEYTTPKLCQAETTCVSEKDP